MNGITGSISAFNDVPLGTDADQKKLLDLIDGLRNSHADKYIDLPQIVVFGNQSAGKSSVLEAVTQIPFPKKETACTRHATQIQLRRDPTYETTITRISIKPGPGTDANKYKSFYREVPEGTDLTKIFEAATLAIFGHLEKRPRPGENFLSQDVLNIERTGKDVKHMMTVVDIPGIIQSETNVQNTQDVIAIKQLSSHYMAKERTIILPIVSCETEYANQQIVSDAKRVDPIGYRTLGILTKPDLNMGPAKKEELIELASNSVEPRYLRLGWHILKNRSHDEMHLTLQQRDEAERRFFKEQDPTWAEKLRPDQLGVENLRQKLSAQLIKHIVNELPKVMNELEKLKSSCDTDLRNLGPALDSIETMRQELQKYCKKSSSLARQAQQSHGGNSQGEGFFLAHNDHTEKFNRNLRSRVVQESISFSVNIELYGAAYKIEGDTLIAYPHPRNNLQPAGILPPENISRRKFIEKEVEPLIQDNPGQELGTDFNPLLTYQLIQNLSRKWPDAAIGHVNKVQGICRAFMTELINYVWPKRLHEKVWQLIIAKSLLERYQSARKELDQVLKDRFRNIRNYSSLEIAEYERAKEALFNNNSPSQTKFTVYEEILLKALIHYKHLLPIFIWCITVQVIERHLVDNLEEIFEATAYTLPDSTVRTIMEEDKFISQRRTEVINKRNDLIKGLKLCYEFKGEGTGHLNTDPYQSLPEMTSKEEVMSTIPDVNAPDFPYQELFSMNSAPSSFQNNTRTPINQRSSLVPPARPTTSNYSYPDDSYSNYQSYAPKQVPLRIYDDDDYSDDIPNIQNLTEDQQVEIGIKKSLAEAERLKASKNDEARAKASREDEERRSRPPPQPQRPVSNNTGYYPAPNAPIPGNPGPPIGHRYPASQPQEQPSSGSSIRRMFQGRGDTGR